MRHGSRFDGLRLPCSTALVGLALSAGLAQAQTRPGWVDPPARQPTEAPAPEKAPPARPAAEAPQPKSSQPNALAETPPVKEATQEAAKETARPERPMAVHRRRLATPAPETRRGAGSREEAASEHLRVHPRIARTPAMAPSTASESNFPAWAIAATRLTDTYLDSVSGSGDGMVAAAPRFYAERVQFHGRSLSLAALMAEKRRFVRRWPERRYEAQGGATRTACNAATATCIVRTTFDFRADNPARGARSQGVSELTLTISFAGPRPVIVAESSRVLRRYGAGALSAIAGRQRGA
ncbi:hypothetical protein MKK58_00840 [Methylobacterium sp. J-078]|uniref:hypothetical protein n=1 Tax=Methylobacterium sp. J-078 TaxID=2836657 RepID=UPI001FBA1A4A|nr:hypothetical protein [Methylobacterium sp. J-078]MCJ2043100.1 hypothetical protein [Methylobacterium sp. J-078]